MKKQKVIVAITGASGSIYAKTLMDSLLSLDEQLDTVGVVMSDNAKEVWRHEIGDDSFKDYAVDFYDKNDFYAPFSSGSSQYHAMIICPCSMGTMSRITNCISNDLITRAADVMLKERRKLILVARESPYNIIHLKNMMGVTEAGGIVCPATPSFYSKPQDFESLARTVTDRVLDLAGFEVDCYRWGK